MKRLLLILPAVVLVACSTVEPNAPAPATGTGAGLSVPSGASRSSPSPVAVVAENLQIPWALVFLPGGDLLVTERPGRLLRIGADRRAYEIDGVRHRGEGGLLGLALHPDFATNRWVYLYLTTEEAGVVSNRIERYVLGEDALSDETEILSGIPGSSLHDGGALAFGPDGKLYVTTGDAQQEENAQRTDTLGGKVLRLNDDGSIPEDNPFQNAVWSYGHRNAQGLAWDDDDQLWISEHGRSIPLSGYDEINRIEKGKNYGWPRIQGTTTKEGMEPPIIQSGAFDTWAPASLAFLDGALYFGGLKAETLYEVANPSAEPRLLKHLTGEYGRIRAVSVSPDGFLYITTSNTDGRGAARAGDDRILRIDPAHL